MLRSGSRLRYLKAYRAFLVIFTSYLFFALQKRILGEGWAVERRVQVHRRNARRIEKTILELKGLFIKVGQMLSIMTNFLPEELTQGLQGLQDAVPPHPYKEIEERFVQEFGKKPRELFASFEEQPIASASLGQVHVARLRDGTKVAVKVQYPEIDQIVRIDLRTMKRIFGFLNLLFPVYGLKEVYAEIADVITHELDYVYEGKNLEQLKKNFENEPEVLFPDLFWDLSSSKILTLRFMEGIKVGAVEELKKAGVDPREVATKIIHAYCKQIFIDGVYHADPHPGNLLVQVGRPPQTSKIVLVDFGAMARISEEMRVGITLFAEGLIKRDTRMLAQAMRQMGFVARQDSFEPFDQLVEYFYEKLSHLKIENFRNLNISQLQDLESLIEIKKMNISLRDLMTSFHVPKDWILLERTLLLAMGLCAHLDPTLNPIDIVLPYVEKFVLQDRPLGEVVGSLIKEIGMSYLRLPHEIQRTLKKLNEGSLTLKTDPQHTQRLYLAGHQLLYAFLAVSGLFLELSPRRQFGDFPLWGAGFFGLVLTVSLVKNRRG